MKALIFDSSTLINLSMNGILDILEQIKKRFKGRFLITQAVKHETVDRPLKIKKFELAALQINNLLNRKIIEMLPLGEEIYRKTREIRELVNSSFFAKGEALHLIDDGEASCLALSKILEEKGEQALVVIDERTTRMLCEKPENLRKLLESKLHTKVETKKELSFFKRFKIIRSAELVYLTYKKGLIEIGNGNLLDALLYAVKFKGCAISSEEIEEIKRM